jgi:hypothetical protein
VLSTVEIACNSKTGCTKHQPSPRPDPHCADNREAADADGKADPQHEADADHEDEPVS